MGKTITIDIDSLKTIDPREPNKSKTSSENLVPDSWPIFRADKIASNGKTDKKGDKITK